MGLTHLIRLPDGAAMDAKLPANVLTFVFCSIATLAVLPPNGNAQETPPAAWQGHTAAVNAAVYTSNQRYIVTGGADQLVKIWDPQNGKLVRQLEGHIGQVMNVAVSPDNAVIVSAASDNTLRMWDIPRPEPLRTFPGVDALVNDLDVSPNGQWAISVSENHNAHIWRMEDMAGLFTLQGHAAPLVRTAVRNDGNQVATADATGELRLWNPIDGAPQGTLGAHVGSVNGMQFHPNNQQLVTAGEDGQLKVWQLPLTPPKPLAETGSVQSVAISTDGQTTLTGGDAGVRGYTTSSGALAREYPGIQGTVHSVAISGNNATCAAAGEAGTIKFWNLGDAADRFDIIGHDGPIQSIAFHPDNNRIASAGEDGTIRLWRLPTAPVPLNGHTADIVDLTFAPNGQMAVSISADKTVRAWNPASGQLLWQQTAGEHSLTALSVRADSAQLAHGDAVGELQIRSASDGALQQSIGAHDGELRSITWHPTGESLATVGADNALKVWNLPAPPVVSFEGNAENVSAVALAQDGSWLLTAGADKSIRVFDAASGQQTRTFTEVPDAVTALALNLDQSLTAAGHANGTIKFWKTADGSPFQGADEAKPQAAELFGHDGAVTEVVFDAESQSLVSAGADGTIRIWRLPQPAAIIESRSGATTTLVTSPDGKLAAVAGFHQEKPAVFLFDIATAETVQILLGHEAAINSICFHAEGKLLATGGADNTARVWNLADPKFPEVQKVAHESAVSAVAISSDGTQLYTACADNVIRCWNVADGSEVRTLSGHGGAVVRMAVRGATLFSASADGTLRLWKTTDGTAIRSISHGGAVTSLAVDEKGTLVASGGADNNVKLWNAADGAAIATLAGHSTPPVDLQFNADATRLVSLSNAGLWLWDVAGQRRLESFILAEGEKRGVCFWQSKLAAIAADGQLRLTAPNLTNIFDAHVDGVLALTLSPDGKQIVSSGADKTVKLWNRISGKLLATFAGPTDIVQALRITPDGKHLIGGGLDKILYVWALPAAPQQQPVAAVKQWELPAAITSLHVDNAAKRVAIGGDDNLVRVWDWTIERELQRFAGHTATVLDVQLSADGNTIASASADKTARKSTLALAHIAVLEHAPRDLAYTPDGSQLVLAAEQPELTLWSVNEQGIESTGTIPAANAKIEGFMANPQAAVSIRGDGNQVASIDSDGRVHVWNASDKTLAFTVAAPELPEPAEGEVEPAEATEPPNGSLQFSADGGKLLIGKYQSVRVVDTLTGRFLQQFAEPANVSAIAMALDNLTIAIGRTGAESNGALRQFALERWIPAHDGAVKAIVVTPDGNGLLSGGDDKAVHLWSVAEGTKLRSYVGSDDEITTVAITRNGQRILAGGLDKKVRIWPLAASPAEGEAPPPDASIIQPTTTWEFPSVVRDISSSVDNTRLAVATDDGVIRVRDQATGHELERFHSDNPVQSVAFAPDNRTVVSGETASGEAAEDETPTNAHIWTMSLVRSIAAEEGPLHGLSLAAGGAQAVTVGASGVKHWNLGDGNLLRQFNIAESEFTAVAVRGDNQQVVASDAENRLHFWNLANGEEAVTTTSPAAVHKLRYSSDNQKLVALCADNHLRFFDPADGKLTYELTSDKPLSGVAFTTDNRNVLTGGEELRQWLYASPTAIRTLSGHGGSVYSATFSRDGRWIASTSADQTVRIWNAATGTQEKQLSGHDGGVYSASFSPDGSLLVSCGADKSIRLWDTLGGRQLKQIPVGEDSLYTVAFFPDGKRVATAGLDRMVYIVDAITGKVENKLDKHSDYLYRVTFNNSGARLLTCGYGGNIVVWNAANGQALYETSLQQVTNFADFAPDGSRIVVAGGEGKVHFLDVPANAK